MEYIAVLLVAAAVFGICFLVDKGFTKLFRGKAQHASGLAVRLNKRYATIGVILIVLGLGGFFAGFRGYLALLIAGSVVIFMGLALIIYYLSVGIFYDQEGFVYSKFGKASITYQYNQIEGQLLYNASGNIVIELHMKDGKSVSLQSTMTGVYPFLDMAFENWCRQTGRDPEGCDFHDPDNSLWFPMMEG